MARPTKFKKEYITKLLKFFDIEAYKQVISESSKELFKEGGVRKESVKYRLIPNKMPTLFRFARNIGVNYSTVWRWAEKGNDEALEKMIESQMKAGKTDKEALEIAQSIQEFCNAYKEAKELQKEFIITLGLAGASPAPFAIFTAKNVTDMRDKIETDITSKGEKLTITGMTFTDDTRIQNKESETTRSE
jgi:hypothetical protein